MFHRVRPEAEQEKQPAPAENKVTVKPLQSESEQPAKTPEAKTETPQKEASSEQEHVKTTEQPAETTNTKKDTKDMNEQPQAATGATESDNTLDKTAGAYQRPGQAPVQNSPYTSSYASTSTYAAPTAPDPSHAGDRTLTIGRGITMSGEIEACDYLLVEGTVEAALKGASVLDISESGTFYGTVEIGEATVAGRFEGDITVTGRLTIKAGGVITGSIAYGELEVESGAIIDGRLTPVAVAPAQAAPEAPKEKPAAEALKKAKEQDPAPANTDGELFSSKTA